MADLWASLGSTDLELELERTHIETKGTGVGAAVDVGLLVPRDPPLFLLCLFSFHEVLLYSLSCP